MQDKDKLFLVVYFGVQHRPVDVKTNQIMVGFYENLKKTLDDTVNVYLVPEVTTDEVKLELLNVEKVSDEKIEEIKNIYEKLLNELKKSL